MNVNSSISLIDVCLTQHIIQITLRTLIRGQTAMKQKHNINVALSELETGYVN